MTIRDLEIKYEELLSQRLRGELDEEDFRREVQQLQYVDELGRRWRIGWYTGKWYREEHGEWTQAQPRQAEPLAGTPRAHGAQAGGVRPRRSWAIWLAAILATMLLVAAAILVAGWGLGWWAQDELAQVDPTASPQPTDVQPTDTQPPTITVAPTSTRPRPTSTRASSATPLPTATSTASPTPPATSAATSTASPAATTAPTAGELAGHIYYPAYDASARTFHIYDYDLRAGTRQLLVRQASQPAISPNGQRLAYRSWNRGSRDISVRELADGHTWSWVNYAEAARPSWSPDSQNIVFPSQHVSDREWRMYYTVGTRLELVRRHGGDLFGRVPTWLAGGDIVYWECPLNQCGLYRMHRDGSSPVRLSAAERDTAPAPSPDGRSVAFMSMFQDNWEIQVTTAYPAGEPSARRLTTSASQDGLPTWSPDGEWIAFVSDRGGSWAVWAVRPDGSGTRKLFELGAPLEGRIEFVADDDQHGWLMETLAWGP